LGVTHVRAHAKINLALAVAPPEPVGGPKAGWHRIASWFACVNLFDDLYLHRAEHTTLERRWHEDAVGPSPLDWPAESDLCLKALRALEARAGRPLPTRIALDKKIPVGGGMGGGSSDAAAVLVGCNRLHDLGLSAAELRDLSRPLGSDIAFFIDDQPGPAAPARPAIVEGFGDRLRRVEPAPAEVVLFFPRFGCPTREVYRAFDALSPGPLRDAEVAALHARAAREGKVDSAALFNDLARAAEAVAPALAQIRRALSSAANCPVHVTGSGSTLFAIADDAGDAQRIVRACGRAEPDMAMVVTRLV
jgi:4-diphosphocytidyl-2-C-methyl-D-erythritol kinase